MQNLIKEELPTYKALNNLKNCTDIDLIASILGGGEKALNIAREIYTKAQSNLFAVSTMSKGDLLQLKGIGEKKAASFLAAMEFYRRAKGANLLVKSQIRSSHNAYNILAPLMEDLDHEEFYILVLNRANRVIGTERISVGGLSGTVVDVKKIYSKVLRGYPKANAIILSHNHPSGNLAPSEADIRITKKVKEAGQNLDIKVLDHIIIAGPRYLSFGDEGYL
jgi:DNA repair protein RadC